MQLSFLGGSGAVTGSRYLIETNDGSRILVDCGLFQGLKHLRERNRAAFPVPPESLDAVLPTHAHIDHTGYLPMLVRDGSSAPIYATGSTGTFPLRRISPSLPCLASTRSQSWTSAAATAWPLSSKAFVANLLPT